MKGISREKKLEVAQCYILGDSYIDIENKTGVSHGSIVNIVNEVVNGKLDVPGTTLDQVIDLHQLSLDLKKKGLSPSQALLGVSTLETANKAGIAPSYFDQ